MEFPIDVLVLMEYGLSGDEFKNVVMECVRAITEGTEPEITNRERPYFARLYKESKRRAEAWLNKTKNFREHNPSKKPE